MARYEMMSVLDMVAQQFGRPFFTVSEGSAIRGFSDEVNRESESVLHTHPADFQLFHLGTFDDETASVDLNSTPRLVVAGSAVVVRKSAE